MTILQMHLTRDGTKNAIEAEDAGLGRILWVPVPVWQVNSWLPDLPVRMIQMSIRTLRRRQLDARRLYDGTPASFRSLWRHYKALLKFKRAVLSDSLADLIVPYHVDLLAMHWLSYDAESLIPSSLRARVPFVLINHFENARLLLPEVREWISRAAAVGTVSSQQIPRDLRRRCVNLSDAVDTEFFTPQKARSLPPPARPFVLLPGRIQEGKGHYDLMQAARIMLAKKIDLALSFAGVVDSEPLIQELHRLSANMGLSRRIRFLGEISAEELRDWYAASSIVVLPSYSEGLPRVLLEAQAMKKAVVAYNAGGIREAVLPGETGYLVKAGNVEDLAEKVGFLLQNDAERQRMGERGREFVCRHFSVGSLIRRHEAFYLDVLSGARTWRSGAFTRQ
ncbi:MAG: glycosyltransferase [Terriglobia bacterium]